MISLAFVLQGCVNNKKRNDNFYRQPDSQANISYQKLDLDSIPLDSVTTSFVVESGLCDSIFYVLDRYFCTLYRYDLSGKLIDKKLGQGRAKNETSIGRIASHVFLDNGDLVLLDYNGSYSFYDKDILMKDYLRVLYERGKNDGRSFSERYSDPYSYSRRYENLICRSYDKAIYFNAELSSLDCGYIPTTDMHLERNANILEMDLEKEEFGRLLAVGFPESYKINSLNKVLFSDVSFDIAENGDFYVSYQADSLLYHYNHSYEELESYGFSGRDMNMAYVKIDDFEVMSKYYMSEKQSKGYYTWLEYVDETGLLFRSYQKGGSQSTDGLQIYKDGVLLGDINVPKGLKVMGYVSPYYYSYVIADEEREIMYMYRFKL